MTGNAAMSAITVVLVQGAMVTLAALLAVACIIGVAVLLRPACLERLRRIGGGQPVARMAHALNTPYNLDRWFYRRHRVYGAAVGLLALVLLGYLTFGDTRYHWLGAVDPRYRDIAAMVADSARIVLWVFGVLGLVMASVVFTRPSALKGLERPLNRWISPSRSISGLERRFESPDRWAARNPRAWGAIIALLSAACLLALALHADSLAQVGL